MALNRHESGAQDPGRDPALDRLYAAAVPEEPPARLDAAILAAARREVRSGPRPLGSVIRAWRVPVSIAAVVVLSASLVLLMKEEGADRFYDAPAPAVRQHDAATDAARDAVLPPASSVPERKPAETAVSPPLPTAPAAKSERERMERPAPQAREDRLESQRAAAPPAAQPSQSPARAQETDTRLKSLERAEEPPAAPAVAPAKPGPPADALAKRSRADAAIRGNLEQADRAAPEAAAQADPAPLAKAAPRSSPYAERGAGLASRAPVWSGFEQQPAAKWVERIEELRRTGRENEAREMLEEFKRRFPDHPLPASLAR